MTSGHSAKGTLMRCGQGETLRFEWGQITWLASAALGNSRETTFGRVLIKAGGTPGTGTPTPRRSSTFCPGVWSTPSATRRSAWSRGTAS